ncbi:MAG: VOC family protein [Gammaproteobacteria bacterium]
MPHRSRVCAVLFDVNSASYEAEAGFWAGALGRALAFDPAAKYTGLPGELDYLIQKTDEEHTGVHIDIETDDVAAEVARLEKLGALKRNQVKDWWVMVDPGGHPFCVVPVQSKSWPKDAIEWP